MKNVELAVVAIASPFDIHGLTVVTLDRHGITSELLGLVIADRKVVPLGVGNIDSLHRAADPLRIAKDHLDGFFSDALAQDRRSSRPQIRLIDVELIGVHRTLHHRLAKAI